MILLLTLLMVFSFTGCDRNGDKPGEDEPIKIGLTDALQVIEQEMVSTQRGVDMFLNTLMVKVSLRREVVVVYEDDQGNETAAVNAIRS